MGLIEKIDSCSTAFDKWGHDLALKFKSDIADCKKRLDTLLGRDVAASMENFNETKKKYISLLTLETKGKAILAQRW